LQDRSRQTYERILNATEALLVSREFDAVRIEEILAEAGVSTGSFYARFEDKEALLSALNARYADGLRQLDRADAHPTDVPPTLAARARAEVRHRIARFRRRRGLIRTISLEQRRDPVISAEMVRLTRRVNRRIVEFFEPCFAEIGHDDPERAVVRGAYFVAAVCRDRMLFATAPHAASVGLPLSQLEDELTVMLNAYLRG
jgi:AcrR family transcriptional regulator